MSYLLHGHDSIVLHIVRVPNFVNNDLYASFFVVHEVRSHQISLKVTRLSKYRLRRKKANAQLVAHLLDELVKVVDYLAIGDILITISWTAIKVEQEGR